MDRKIIFFDIDGTLTSELDRQIPESCTRAIREARKNGHLMFINTGRCFQNVEPRFREIGFDGFVCGCGTDIYCGDERIFHVEQPHEIAELVMDAQRRSGVELLFESSKEVSFSRVIPLAAAGAIRHLNAFTGRKYDLSHDPASADFTFDKFVIWFHDEEELAKFCSFTDPYFTCIDRGGDFREFVPVGCSKATGLQMVLDHYGLSLDQAYAMGDSNNDLAMLDYVPHSIAMGNSSPKSLMERVEYVTKKASEDGVEYALRALGFID